MRNVGFDILNVLETVTDINTKVMSEATIEGWVIWSAFGTWTRIFDFGQQKNAVVVQNLKDSRTLRFVIYDKKGKEHRIRAKKPITTTGEC